MNSRLPASALAATLALTPVLTGAAPGVAATDPIGGHPDRSRLLSVSRGPLASGPNADGAQMRSDDVSDLLEAILAKLDGLADRPIDVSVTTKLDGRQIARAVYKDMREQKVKNYDTM